MSFEKVDNSKSREIQIDQGWRRLTGLQRIKNPFRSDLHQSSHSCSSLS